MTIHEIGVVVNTEPVRLVSAVEALLLALIGVAAYVFGWGNELTALVVATVGPAIAVVSGAYARSKVTPVG